jgi:Peptidase A4 family
MNGRRAAVLGAAFAAGIALLAASAAQATKSPYPHSTIVVGGAGTTAKMVTSPNWSGYVATGPSENIYYGHPYFTSVTGTWTVPKATCGKPKAKASSTVWVGLGGYATRNQEEVGTDSNCHADGTPFYYAWFELVPYLSFKTFPNIKAKVQAGDTVTGLVKVLKPTLVLLQLENKTEHWTFSKKIAFSSQDTTTADWVVEAPADCEMFNCTEASLSNFGKATMRDISATARGKSGNLKDPRWRIIPIKLVPSTLIVPTISTTATGAGPGGKKGKAASPAGATPGPVSKDGSSFSWKWVPVASRGNV